MATFTSDGSNPVGGGGNSVAAKVALASAGDTVTIPAGTFTWAETLNVTKNIILRGPLGVSITSGTLPRIQGAAGLTTLLRYTCENTSGFTAELANLEFYGDMPIKVIIDGVSTINRSTYTGGMRIHDCRWARDMTLTAPAPTDANGQPYPGAVVGFQFDLRGWVFGVIYRCEVRQSLNAFSAAQWRIAHNTNDLGLATSYPDYSQYQLPAGFTDLAGTLDMWVFEDCIFRNAGALTDCPGDVADGTGRSGARYCARHNTFWGAFASHGTRDSGGNGGRGARHMEFYNNHFVRNNYTIQSVRHDVNITEIRDGECVGYNNFATFQVNTPVSGGVDHFISPNPYGHLFLNPSAKRYAYGSDGLNPWDFNAKGDPSTGKWTDPVNGNDHYVYDTYSPAVSAADPDGMIFHGWSNGNDFKNRVVNGVDDDPKNRYSDVFGTITVSGATITADNISGTVHGKNLPANLDHYFDNFTVRCPDVPRTQFLTASSGIAWKHVHLCTGTSNATSGNNGTQGTVNLLLDHSNPSADGKTNQVIAHTGSVLELRRVVVPFSANGRGTMLIPFKRNSNPAILAEPNDATAVSTNNNPRYSDRGTGGFYSIGNRTRAATAALGANTPFVNEDLITQYEGVTDANSEAGQLKGVIRDFHHGLDWAYNYGAGRPNGTSELKAGYPWNPTLSTGGTNPGPNTNGTQAKCLVGADWSNSYVDGTFGVGANNNDIAASGNGGTTPEFASFYVQGAVDSLDCPYPHPLRSAPVSSPPSFTNGSTDSANFAPGQADTKLIPVSGSLPITVSVSSGTLPTGVTLTNSPSARLLADTSTTSGITTLTLQASNSAGSATQTVTITIDSPTTTLLSPTPNATTTVNHLASVTPTVSLSADATALSGINKVEFYEGTNLISTQTAPNVAGHYAFTWTGMADGTYTIKARAYDAGLDTGDSATATVIVATVGPPPLPAPAQIVVR